MTTDTTTGATTETTDVETRLRRIEDRQEITDLVVLYGFVMDERIVADIPRLFTDDATLRSADGVFAASGIEEIVRTYQGRFDVLGPTNHFTHGHVVRFDAADPGRATGLLASHAEVVRNGRAMWVALRYRDVFRRTAEGWRIADRLMSYMYYVPVDEYAGVLPREDRVRAYAEPTPGDWPVALRGEDTGWISGFFPTTG